MVTSITDISNGSSAGPHTTDAAILQTLRTFEPVQPGNEKNVWAFWDKGLAAAPGWNQRNIAGWVRRLGPSWKVRVLDAVEGSPSHYLNYIKDTSLLPQALLEKTMDGKHVPQHSSDIIRTALLLLYGGVWLDVGFLLFRHLDDLCWDALADSNQPYEMCAFSAHMGPNVGFIFNGFIAARKDNPCIRYWHQTFVKVWEGAQNTTGMSEHPLLRHLPRYEPPSRDGKMPPFRYAQFVDYIAQVFCLERVRHLVDPSIGWNGPEYFKSRVLLFDCSPEVYYAQRLTMWDGRKQFDLLSRKREGAEGTEEYKEAEEFVQGILANSATMKISHGLQTAGREYLAELWDKKENEYADCTPGTFAAYLRYESEHSKQIRRLEPRLLPVLNGALLEGDILQAVGDPRAE